MTENSKNNEKAKKTKNKEKRRRSKRRKADVRLLPLLGFYRWLCSVSPLTGKKDEDIFALFVFLHFQK
jgi:hypothetical protein